MKKIFILYLFLFWLFGGFPDFAQAQELPPQSALGVSPAIVEEVLTPGEAKEISIKIFNITNFPLPVKGFSREFLVREEVMGEVGEIFNASSWITLEPADLILQPQEVREIKIIINPSKAAEPGGHYATIFFQPLLPQEAISARTAYNLSRVGVLGFFIVRGEMVEKAVIKDFSVQKFQQFGPIEFKLSLENQGNLHLLPQGRVRIYDWRGREKANLSLKPATVLPQTIREFQFSWPERILFGKFKAQAEVFYGSEKKDIKSEIFSFWIIPFVPILSGFVILTILLFFITMARKRFSLAVKVLLGKTQIE
ncbi:MAG TPA: hypothetical protein VMW25_05610 [Clostridia bacterium]|nr:hypothetical protein [Clostridia bacterium]